MILQGSIRRAELRSVRDKHTDEVRPLLNLAIEDADNYQLVYISVFEDGRVPFPEVPAHWVGRWFWSVVGLGPGYVAADGAARSQLRTFGQVSITDHQPASPQLVG